MIYKSSINQSFCTLMEGLNGKMEFLSNISQKRDPQTVFKWHKDIVTYRLTNDTDDIPDNSFEHKALTLGFESWRLRIPLKFKRVYENADINVSFSKDDPYFKDNLSVLAYAWYPNGTELGGDMVFNDNKVWSKDGKGQLYVRPEDGVTITRKTFCLPHVMMHEGGHAIGLPHTTGCPECIMNPLYNGRVTLNPTDVTNVQQLYGKRTVPQFWINHVEKTLMKRLGIVTS